MVLRIMHKPQALEKLISAFHSLPRIGPKLAEKISFHILKMKRNEVVSFLKTIIEAKNKVKFCPVCGGIAETDKDLCRICDDPARNQKIVCVIEKPQDIFVIEKTGQYKGVYHVLGGALSPLDGIGPDQLRMKELIERAEKDKPKEVIIATGPNAEGETTALYIAKLIKPLGVNTTRIATGIPVGGDLEYTDEVTLGKALEGRREI